MPQRADLPLVQSADIAPVQSAVDGKTVRDVQSTFPQLDIASPDSKTSSNNPRAAQSVCESKAEKYISWTSHVYVYIIPRREESPSYEKTCTRSEKSSKRLHSKESCSLL
jgi:hypothetical protein